MSKSYTVDDDFNGSRLDKWFKNKIINLPHSLFEKILRQNKVKVNKIINNSIVLIVLKDKNPIYKFTSATSCEQVLNYNMKMLKIEMRYLIGGDMNNFNSVHSSYNVEESLLVLNPLNLSNLIPEQKFDNFKQLFDLLNNDEYLKYVILFDYNMINNNNDNIKILVNDYYYFKSITGARSTDKINMRENDNGFNVNNNIIVNNKLININVRFIGDNYFDSTWQKNILSSFLKINLDNYQIKVTSEFNQYYTILYHIMIHKNFNYDKDLDYIKYLKIDKPYNKNLLTIQLKNFIKMKKYSIPEPIDKYVKFYNNFF